MRKTILPIFIFICMSTLAIGNIYRVPSVIHQSNESQNLAQDLHNNIHASAVPFTPVLNSLATLSLPQVGVVTAYSTSQHKELSQEGIRHSVVNSNYAHVSKTFEIDLFT